MPARLSRRAVGGSVAVALGSASAAALALVGHRLFVDATAAVYYNADYRIPEAVSGAWVYASAWSVLNVALAYVAYRRRVLPLAQEMTRLVAAWLLVLDASFLVLLSVRGGSGSNVMTSIVFARGGGGSDIATSVIFAGAAAALGLFAWRRPGLGGGVLISGAVLVGYRALLGSATYEGEAAGLLFDEDTLFIFVFGLVPLASGLLFVVSPLFSSAARAVRSVTLLICIGVLAGATAGCGSQSGGAGSGSAAERTGGTARLTKVQRIPFYGVSFALPESWAAIDWTDSKGALEKFKRDNPRYADAVGELSKPGRGRKFIAANGGAKAGLIVYIWEGGPGFSLKRDIRINLPPLEQAGASIVIYGKHDEIIDLPGGRAWRVRWSGSGPLGEVQIVQYTFVRGRMGYLFTYSTVRPYDDYATLFTKSARSIRINVESS